jgi:hypothetical protein
VADLRLLADNLAGLPAGQREPLLFARKLTCAPHSITDEEVTRLIALHGEKQVVALVLLVAYANFQDGLLLALNVSADTAAPSLPLQVRFVQGPVTTRRTALRKELPAIPLPESRDEPNWPPLSNVQLQGLLREQQHRQPRLQVPGSHPAGIQWWLVCHHYQPRLAAAWSACTRAFGQETDQDRVFEESLFWVVTRTTRCFY